MFALILAGAMATAEASVSARWILGSESLSGVSPSDLQEEIAVRSVSLADTRDVRQGDGHLLGTHCVPSPLMATGGESKGRGCIFPIPKNPRLLQKVRCTCTRAREKASCPQHLCKSASGDQGW